MALTWEDAEDIAAELVEAHPEVDPLTVRFTDLHKWVIALPDFRDDPMASSEGKLERIQMARGAAPCHGIVRKHHDRRREATADTARRAGWAECARTTGV